ncbi:MAG: hypothetical protein LBI69_04430 [Puniceicoccales bacterium]|jgi:hypothetical protein|nr:hypothetical protein [Puniceicoccales bacterium]
MKLNLTNRIICWPKILGDAENGQNEYSQSPYHKTFLRLVSKNGIPTEAEKNDLLEKYDTLAKNPKFQAAFVMTHLKFSVICGIIVAAAVAVFFAAFLVVPTLASSAIAVFFVSLGLKAIFIIVACVAGAFLITAVSTYLIRSMPCVMEALHYEYWAEKGDELWDVVQKRQEMEAAKKRAQQTP